MLLSRWVMALHTCAISSGRNGVRSPPASPGSTLWDSNCIRAARTSLSASVTLSASFSSTGPVCARHAYYSWLFDSADANSASMTRCMIYSHAWATLG